MCPVCAHRGVDGCCTLASVPEDRNQILQNRSSTCALDIRITRSSKTSAVVSTSSAKDLQPYWVQSCVEKSQSWLSRTETGCVGSDLNSSNELLVSTTAGSWFSTTHSAHLNKNLSAISFPSSTFSPAGFTDCESTLQRCHRIRIYPEKASLPVLRRYLGLSRYWYNQTIAYLKQPDTVANLAEVRKILQGKEQPDWALDCPQRIREHAMAEACEAVKQARAKFRKGYPFQDVGFRSRKDCRQRFGFDKKSLTDGKVFREKAFRVVFHQTEQGDADAEGTRIVFENKQWFLIVPVKQKIQKPETQRLPIVALDPGVRTFMTYYAPEVHGKIGCGDFGRIQRLCYHLDGLVSRRDCARGRQRKRMNKALARARVRIGNLIDDLHHKAARFLTTRFATVYIPAFETGKMVTKLGSKTARSMLTFAHYRFAQFLKQKAELLSCAVNTVSEAYTSKTCSYCGKIHNIGSKKIMSCSCGSRVDRDYNGARGILLRALAATPSV